MKKIVLLTVMAMVLASGLVSSAKEGVSDTLLLYVPNRIVDFTDIFSASAGFGPVIRADVWATRDMSFGAGIGSVAKAVKGYNRQYGAGLEEGREASFMVISFEEKDLSETSRGLKSYTFYNTGIPSPSERIYNFYEGERDFWSIGVTGGVVLFELGGEFHIVEFADFLTGFVFIDLKGDDFDDEKLKN